MSRFRRLRMRARRIIAWSGATAVAATVLVCGGVGAAITARVGGKAGAPRSATFPQPRLADPEPILQLEDHTCGLLSLSSAYRAYGLSPEAKNLRFRLGVDRTAHPFDAESTGTLHPDLLRVLVQDGFRYHLLNPRRDDAADLLDAHLDSGNLALLLIRRRENGGLHWVLTDRLEQDALRIVDSLREDVYTEPGGEFIRDHVLSVIAVAPDGSRNEAALSDAHADGLAEMNRVRRRLRDRD